jgi:hypothetical protein
LGEISNHIDDGEIIMSNSTALKAPRVIFGPQSKSITISSKYDPWTDMATPPKKTYSNEDLLAVSAYLYRRYRDNPEIRFNTNLQSESVGRDIQGQDRQRAEEIAEYFSKQIVLARLKDTVSDFQQAVASFLSGDRKTIKTADIGLIYRLPEYYEYALSMLEYHADHFADHEYCEIPVQYATRLLMPHMSIEHNTRHLKSIQYWFKDRETGNPAMITVTAKNQLQHVWDKVFNAGRTEGINISGMFDTRKHYSGFSYMTCYNRWELEI